MKKISYSLVLASLALCTFSPGCKKALDVDPRQSIDETEALTTRDGINAAIISVYSTLKSARNYGRDLIAFPEALGDNGWATNKSGRLLPEANNNFNAHFGLNLWANNYSAINQTNLILEALPNAPITAAERTSWEGQLLFLRGLYYFDLVKAFAYMPGAVVAGADRGGVPLQLTGTRTSEAALALKLPRSPIDSVYMQIVADLEGANSRLTTAGLPSLANKAAAQALLSRVHLYSKNYTESKRWADSAIVLAGSRLTTGSAYISQWRAATHQETLFQVAFTSNNENIGVNESLQTSFTTLVVPGNPAQLGGFGDLVPTITLLNDLGITLVGGNTVTNFKGANAAVASRTADTRNQLYEAGSTGRGKSYVETTKFIGKNGFINLDNVPVIRIAEVYLTRAEVLATPGSPQYNEAAALLDLNKILNARGLPDAALTGTALYEEILRQRRIELAFEGHRFWDLKRLGRDVIKFPLFAADLAFTDIRILAPIPQREVDLNPNLKQNPGY